MSELADFKEGDRVVVKGYDVGCGPEDSRYDGLTGTVVGDYGIYYVRVIIDDEPDPTEAAMLASAFGLAGTLFEPGELELI